MKSVELLVPAGDKDAFRAAVLAGANAIYFGLPKFNARQRAENISLKDLPKLIPLAKSRGIRTYLTVNTLILEKEMQSALEMIVEAVNEGVDAVIVQDWGVLYLLKKHLPSIEVHASTQLNSHNSMQVNLLANMGCSQINIARELNLMEIKELVSYMRIKSIKSEVFVHGAYCVSFSGQCYLSTALYGSAGNRGECVQPCRRAYKTESDQRARLPFNLKDNSAFAFSEELIEASVDSLKIEGRIKDAEYVWAATTAWREQIDRIADGKIPLQDSPLLRKIFNRDLTDGYIKNRRSRDMFTELGKDQSLQLTGDVVNYHADQRELTVNGERLIPGDTITIKRKDGEFVCTGVVKEQKTSKKYRFIITNKMAHRISPYDQIWRTPQAVSPDWLKTEISNLQPIDSVISVEVSGSINKPLAVKATCNGSSHTLYSKELLTSAEKREIDMEMLRERLGKLGGTGFCLGEITSINLNPGLFLPIKELNELKRAMVAPFLTGSEHLTPPILEPHRGGDKRIKNGEAIFLSDSLDDIREVQKLGKTAVFELPLSINKTLIDEISENRDLILQTSPILTEADLKATTEVLLSLSPRTIICQNSGLANALNRSVHTTVLGEHLNICNSSSLKGLSKYLEIGGYIPSLEISPQRVVDIDRSNNLELWYPLVYRESLLTSRNCLIAEAKGCKKGAMDADCLDSCQAWIPYRGEQGEAIAALKRAGFHTTITRERITDMSDSLKLLRPIVKRWIVDLRSVEGSEKCDISDIVKRSEAQIDGSKSEPVFSQFSRRKHLL